MVLTVSEGPSMVAVQSNRSPSDVGNADCMHQDISINTMLRASEKEGLRTTPGVADILDVGWHAH